MLSSKITLWECPYRQKEHPRTETVVKDRPVLILVGNRMGFISAHLLVSGLNWKIQVKCHSFYIFHSLWEKKPTDDHMTSVLGCKTLQNRHAKSKISLWWLKLRDTDFLVMSEPCQRQHSVNTCCMNGWISPQVTSLHLCLK